MGMDGISIANTGAIRENTSAENTNRVEQSINSDQTNTAQQVQGLANNQRVREKEENEGGGKKQNAPQQKNEEEEFQDGYVETAEEEPQEFSIDDFENPDKDFYVKLNVKDDIIELYDKTDDQLIETISGSELGELVQKLNMASGIFVNKKV